MYKNPPKHTRFVKGRSGNPKGRPRKTMNEIGVDILNHQIPLDVNGEKINVPATEAALISLFRSTLKGEVGAARSFLKHFEKVEPRSISANVPEPPIRLVMHPKICDAVLLAVGIIKGESDSDQEEPSIIYRMETWFLEEALRRNKPKQLRHSELIARSTLNEDEALAILGRLVSREPDSNHRG